MTLTKEQAQWVLGAVDLRVKTEGLAAAGLGLSVAALIQQDFKQSLESEEKKEDGDG